MTDALRRPRVPNFEFRLSTDDREFILARTAEALDSHQWTAGPLGERFERGLAKLTHMGHAVAMSSGGGALLCALEALNVPTDSAVLCPTLTAPPTPHAILASGREVIFADSCSDDLGLDPDDVADKLQRFPGRIGAVIAVHVGGWISPRLPRLQALCQAHGIPLIEDSAHAHGSTLAGQPAGSFGGLATYSFFMTKPLTSAEGGAVTTSDSELAGRLRQMRNYGKNDSGRHVGWGFNFKLSEPNAAVAVWAVEHAPQLLAERRRIAVTYDEALEAVAGLSALRVADCECSYYKYIVTLDRDVNRGIDPGINRGIYRDQLRRRLLLDHGVETAGGVYDVPCHLEPYLQQSAVPVLDRAAKFPQAEDFAQRHLCLPLYPGLTQLEIDLVVEALQRCLSRG